MSITRTKRKKDNVDELIITVKEGGLQAVGSLSPEEMFAFLGGGLPKLIKRMVSKIDDEDGGIYMKRLICKNIIGEIQEFLDSLDEDDDEEECECKED